MSTWHDVGFLHELPANAGREVVVAGRVLALFRVGSDVYAIDGICAHQGGPLAEGTLAGPVVTCPWHGWQYDVRTGGQQITPTICQATFPVRIEGDRILVAVEDGP
jgi:nitrite reductase/ring-hydroxylating ferredoxin subunit